MVGDDVSGLIDDHSRSEGVFDALPVPRPVVPQQFSQRRGCHTLRDEAIGGYGDHCWCGALHGVRISYADGPWSGRGVGGRAANRRGRRCLNGRRRCDRRRDGAADQVGPERHHHEGQGKTAHYRARYESEPAAEAFEHLSLRED